MHNHCCCVVYGNRHNWISTLALFQFSLAATSVVWINLKLWIFRWRVFGKSSKSLNKNAIFEQNLIVFIYFNYSLFWPYMNGTNHMSYKYVKFSCILFISFVRRRELKNRDTHSIWKCVEYKCWNKSIIIIDM